jgi:deoxyribose-phosphate aldolase
MDRNQGEIMEISEILRCVDHTLLSQTATKDAIRQLIDDAIEYKTASVCIPPSFVKYANEYAKGKIKICTVIGFPNGYNTTKTKVFEAKDAINSGADEIDMVINLGYVKDKKFAEIEDEIRQLKTACGDKILKVIVETCLLTDDEKVEMCKIVTKVGADYIKTSTGFSTGGATREDIVLFRENISGDVKMKAAGGIKSLKDAEDYINLGCSRLGTSSIVKILKSQK